LCTGAAEKCHDISVVNISVRCTLKMTVDFNSIKIPPLCGLKNGAEHQNLYRGYNGIQLEVQRTEISDA